MATMSNDATSPSAGRILLRTKQDVELYSFLDGTHTTLVTGITSFHSFSSNGSSVLIQSPTLGITVHDLQSSSAALTLPDSLAVACAYFSPKGTYIVTWERMAKSSDGQSPPANLKVWRRSNGEFVTAFHSKPTPLRLTPSSQQQSSACQWSCLQWTVDELFVFMGVTNEVHVYDGDLKEAAAKPPRGKFRSLGLTLFSLCPFETLESLQGVYHLILFTPEMKAKPARVGMFEYFSKSHSSSNPTSKSFYQTEECSVQWSPNKTSPPSALVLTQTAMDTTGQSYYGSSNLYLFSNKEAVQVPLPNNPTSSIVQDVAWFPNPNKPPRFAVLSGQMPAIGSLHHGTTGEPLVLYGEAHRNTVIWSPHGRFFALAGFGNLAGNVDFWDSNKQKKIPKQDGSAEGCQASCAVGYGWSPDSRYFMVSTTSPRMNVENGIQVWKYNGMGPLHLENYESDKFLQDKLLQAEFVPSQFEVYPDRPQTPLRNANAGLDGGEKKAAEVQKPTGRYVPPAARRANAGGSGRTLADRMNKTTTTPSNIGAAVKVTSGSGGAGNTKRIVGLSVKVETKTASQKKREKQKLARQKATEREEEIAAAEEKSRQENPVDKEKRMKKIKKMLKQIDDLKSRDPATLNDDQKEKMKGEQTLLEEFKSLSVET